MATNGILTLTLLVMPESRHARSGSSSRLHPVAREAQAASVEGKHGIACEFTGGRENGDAL